MKNKIFYSIALSMLFLFSCKSPKHKQPITDNPNDCTEYACPMHPDHTSAVPAECPECHMKMVPVNKGIKRDSTLHQ